ncbi:unnamed protein product [Pleuronectes platessa]|uniref:Uncharacterized protein n=1 Tax=Pleuronectes platessa TaxID=8262 RepID=A0A9N7TXS1_PLEPL|nr:unnamed protein product [Pleuronectes platessa]
MAEACLCAPNIPLSTALHPGTLWAPLHSTPPASAGQLALSTERTDWRPGRRTREGPKEKGLRTGKLVQADDAMQERHEAPGNHGPTPEPFGERNKMELRTRRMPSGFIRVPIEFQRHHCAATDHAELAVQEGTAFTRTRLPRSHPSYPPHRDTI